MRARGAFVCAARRGVEAAKRAFVRIVVQHFSKTLHDDTSNARIATSARRNTARARGMRAP
eukprot:7888320-Lingulodinium_polyedra.AAC.1